ncbi:MAG: ABC transporter ATP-binding protein [Alphaproteobacteria bacterium]|nr:ABC transporter ATP-binding protein [Alphaproteobacteria bacterium]
MTLLAATDLAVSLGGRVVLDGVTLSLKQGELLGVVGPNGAGKTTLLRALAGLIDLDRGRIDLEGSPFTAMARAERGRRIAYVPSANVTHWPLVVERVVALGRLPHLSPWSRPTAVDTAAVARAIRAAGIEHLVGRPVTALSSGERARVLIARALATEARLFFADEPVAALDPHHQLRVLDLLVERCRAGAGAMIVLHDLSLAGRYCDRLLVLDRGRMVAMGPARVVLTADLLADVYGIVATQSPVDKPYYLVPLRRVPTGQERTA